MRKAVLGPPHVREVADGRGAEQDQRKAESNGSQQNGTMAKAGSRSLQPQSATVSSLLPIEKD